MIHENEADELSKSVCRARLEFVLVVDLWFVDMWMNIFVQFPIHCLFTLVSRKTFDHFKSFYHVFCQ